MTKVQNLPPNAPKSPNSHILTWGPFGALRGPSGALGGNIVSLKPLPIKSARKNETFELSMGNTKIFLGVWRVVSMCPTLLNINFSAHFAHIPVPKCAWIAYANQSWSWSHESSWTNRRDITREDCTRFSKGQYINLRIKFSCSHLNQKFNIFLFLP